MRRQVADHLVVVMKRSNVRRAKGVGHPHWNHKGPTGNRRSPQVLVEGGSSRGWHEPCDGRLSRRICEGLGVKFPGPTRHSFSLLDLKGMGWGRVLLIQACL